MLLPLVSVYHYRNLEAHSWKILEAPAYGADCDLELMELATSVYLSEAGGGGGKGPVWEK
jgi:hypothetical protein